MNTAALNITSSNIIDACLQDLNSHIKLLTTTEFRYAKDTIKGIALLLKEKEEICALLDETERNSKITKMTKLMAEPGLVPGKSKEEIEISILARVDLLKTAFLFDKKKNETIFLYKEGFMGPPCFNGRVITLQHYVLQRQGIKTDLFYEFKTPVDGLATQLEEIMYTCSESLGLKGTIPSLEQVKHFATIEPEIFKKACINVNSKNIKTIYSRACEFYVE